MRKEKQSFFYIFYIFHVKFVYFIFFYYLCAAKCWLIKNHGASIQYSYRNDTSRGIIDP